MSVYQRPLRSDELWHSSRKKHKYIEKIGNRYFYSVEELDAFYRRVKKLEKRSNRLIEKSEEARSRGAYSEAKEYDRRQQEIENRVYDEVMAKDDPQRFIEEVERYAEEQYKEPTHKVTVTHTTTVKRGHRL